MIISTSLTLFPSWKSSLHPIRRRCVGKQEFSSAEFIFHICTYRRIDYRTRVNYLYHLVYTIMSVSLHVLDRELATATYQTDVRFASQPRAVLLTRTFGGFDVNKKTKSNHQFIPIIEQIRYTFADLPPSSSTSVNSSLAVTRHIASFIIPLMTTTTRPSTPSTIAVTIEGAEAAPAQQLRKSRLSSCRKSITPSTFSLCSASLGEKFLI